MSREEEAREGLYNQPQRRIAFIDLDGTLYPGLLMEDLVVDQMQEGLLSLSNVPEILVEVQEYKMGKKGQPSNVKALNELWSWACRGKPWIELLDHAKEFVHTNRERFVPNTQSIFDLLRQRGYERWIVTGEPQFVAEAVKKEFGATGYCATKWNTPWEEGQLIFGGTSERPMNSEQKGIWAESFFKKGEHRRPNTREGSIALIDSVNDIGLARAVRWSIVCGDEPSPDLLDYLAGSGKSFVVASAGDVMAFVEWFTDYKNKLSDPQSSFLVYSQL